MAAPKKEDVKARVLHVCMLKRLMDDEGVEGRLMMVGTFVQFVFDLTKKQVDEEFTFDYRFNEVSAKEIGGFTKRRTEPLEIKDEASGETILGTRTTFEARIPLEINPFVTAFPFQINLATAAIELSSSYPDDSSGVLRPDLLLHKEDSRNTVCIQQRSRDEVIMDHIWSKFSVFEKPKKVIRSIRSKLEEIKNQIDKTKNYDFLSPYPEVYYEYDHKKEYCPRFVVSFYAVTPGFQKLVSITFPMILVTVIIFLNVMNDVTSVRDCQDDGKDDCEVVAPLDHLGITSAATITVVFILPQIVESANIDKLFTLSNGYIMLYFFSLILASLPYAIVGTCVPEIVGVGCMIGALLVPMYNFVRYANIRRKIRAQTRQSTKDRRFLLDENYEKWVESHGMGSFASVTDFLKISGFDKNDLYTHEDPDGKYHRIWWNTPAKRRKTSKDENSVAA